MHVAMILTHQLTPDFPAETSLVLGQWLVLRPLHPSGFVEKLWIMKKPPKHGVCRGATELWKGVHGLVEFLIG